MNKIVEDKTIEIILRAIVHNKMIDFSYKKDDGTQSNRTIIPLDFIKSDNTNEWRVFGWCSLREEFRSFRHDRISNLNISSSGEFNQYKSISNGDKTIMFIILRDSEGSKPNRIIQAKYQGTNLQGNLINSGLDKPAVVLTVSEADESFNNFLSEGYRE